AYADSNEVKKLLTQMNEMEVYDKDSVVNKFKLAKDFCKALKTVDAVLLKDEMEEIRSEGVKQIMSLVENIRQYMANQEGKTQIMLSHTGAQKYGYVMTLYDMLVREFGMSKENCVLFLDEVSLEAGDA